MTDQHEFYGWKLVGVLFSLDFLNMGFPYFGGGVINTYMLKEIPMSRGVFGLGFSLVNLVVGLASVTVAACIVWWGVKTTFAIGSGFLVAGGWCDPVPMGATSRFKDAGAVPPKHSKSILGP